jgi:hypothetical protein
MLKPFARHLHHHFLWQFNRRGVAGGLAVGLFCGVILPVGQIVLAAIVAVVFRVNLPVAAFSTLVTNPLTFAPIYYAAYRLGSVLTGRNPEAPQARIANDLGATLVEQQTDVVHWGEHTLGWLQGVGLPLVVGLLVIAVCASVTGYLLVAGIWRWQASRRWGKRNRRKLPRD